jgi:hypothetical protein
VLTVLYLPLRADGSPFQRTAPQCYSEDTSTYEFCNFQNCNFVTLRTLYIRKLVSENFLNRNFFIRSFVLVLSGRFFSIPADEVSVPSDLSLPGDESLLPCDESLPSR